MTFRRVAFFIALSGDAKVASEDWAISLEPGLAPADQKRGVALAGSIDVLPSWVTWA